MKKRVLLYAFAIILFVSCNITPKLDGQYIKIKDNDRGSIMNVLNMNLVTEVNFGENMCRFDYFGTTMSGQYRIDGNYVYIQVGGELGTLAMEITDKETLEGEGWISGTFKKGNSFIAKGLPAVGYYISNKEIDFKAGPGKDYVNIKTVSEGIKVKVVKIVDDNWFQIEYDGYIGYVSNEFLTEEK
jgi:uncharacterized protein YgiM (DUF1202 family)